MESESVEFLSDAASVWRVEYLVKEGEEVRTGGSVVRLTEENAGLGECMLAAPRKGTVHFLTAHGSTIMSGSGPCKVCEVRFCSHPVMMGELCAVCGTRVAQEEGGEDADDAGALAAAAGPARSRVVLQGGSTLSLSRTAAENFHSEKAERLLRERKLALVLDLDSTLIHATDDPRAEQVFVSGTGDIHRFHIAGARGLHYVKLRPGLLHFLEQASRLYELTIYTAGTRGYAEKVAACMDPSGKLFQGRIVSATDTRDLGINNKSLARIFPGGVSMALIMDDREDVWRGEQSRHLILVKPYNYWPSHRDPQSAPGNLFAVAAAAAAAEAAAAAAAASEVAAEAARAYGRGGNSDSRSGTGGAELGGPPSGAGAKSPMVAAAPIASAQAVAAEAAGSLGGHKLEIRGVSPIEQEAAATPAPPAVEGAALVVNAAAEFAAAYGEGAANSAAASGSSTNKSGNGVAESSAAGNMPSGDTVPVGGGTQSGKEKAPATGHRRPLVRGQRPRPPPSPSAPTATVSPANAVSAAASPPPPVATTAPAPVVPATALADAPGPASLQSAVPLMPPTAAATEAPAEAAAAGGESGASSTSASPPPVIEDPQLDCCLALLRNVHVAFYDEEEAGAPAATMTSGAAGAAARNGKGRVTAAGNTERLSHHRDAGRVLHSVRRTILSGAVLVFSGVIPLVAEQPRLHPLWRHAEMLGAEVRPAVGAGVTHVVVARLGSDKASWAQRTPGVFLVHVDWLMHSVWHLRREDEKLFLLAPPAEGGTPGEGAAASPGTAAVAPAGGTASEDDETAAGTGRGLKRAHPAEADGEADDDEDLDDADVDRDGEEKDGEGASAGGRGGRGGMGRPWRTLPSPGSAVGSVQSSDQDSLDAFARELDAMGEAAAAAEESDGRGGASANKPSAGSANGSLISGDHVDASMTE